MLALATSVKGWARPYQGSKSQETVWRLSTLFVVIFPGNVAQWLEGTDAFGLDTDAKRFARLLFQPVLITWPLWSTDAWRTRRRGDVDEVLPTTEAA